MKENKIRELYEASMPVGGFNAFKTNWEQSLGVHRDPDTQRQVFDPSRREINHNELHLGKIMTGLLGPNWRARFEQNWVQASRYRYESMGGPVTSSELAYVSAGLDVIAGLANARALERPMAPKFIFDEMCTVTEIEGEGGFDLIVRSAGNKPARDLAESQALPTGLLKGSRVHRNRTLNQGLRTEISLDTVLNDLTGTLYEAVDENSDQVLLEREQKVADAVMGVSQGSGAANTYALLVSSSANVGADGLAMPMDQDGLAFLPWQNGVYGTNVNATVPSPQNQRLVANFANCSDTDSKGLTDYTAFSRALQMLCLNRDPFTGLAPDIESLDDMTILVAPGSAIQLDFITSATALWQIANSGLSTTGGTNTVSPNVIEKFIKGLKRLTSQTWMNRLLDVGVASVGSTGTYSKKTFNATAGYGTTGSIYSTFFMGKFKQAVKYAQRMPYQVQQVPLSSNEYARQIVSVQDVRERGQAYWVNPRLVYRAFA